MIRVLPRDAFNDANLLKCVGRLTLLIEHYSIPLSYSYDGEPFNIQQDESDGSTYVANIWFYDEKGCPIGHKRPYNSRKEWPLILVVDGLEFYVFDECGRYIPYSLKGSKKCW